MKFKILILAMSAFINFGYAKSSTEKLGDILQIAVPTYAYGLSIYNDDYRIGWGGAER